MYLYISYTVYVAFYSPWFEAFPTPHRLPAHANFLQMRLVLHWPPWNHSKRTAQVAWAMACLWFSAWSPTPFASEWHVALCRNPNCQKCPETPTKSWARLKEPEKQWLVLILGYLQSSKTKDGRGIHMESRRTFDTFKLANIQLLTFLQARP